MNLLQSIVERKREEVADRMRRASLAALRDRPTVEQRDFSAALRRAASGPCGIAAIAEIKRRSPSKGPLCQALDPAALAREYAAGGAAALSVLTDAEFFGGSDEDLRAARGATQLPALRKDFTLDAYQLHESRALGADAVLLIARILEDRRLSELLALASELGLGALVEVHDERELDRAVALDARIIGVNSRDLDTFEVDLPAALRLGRRIPPSCLAVAESGIHTPGDVQRVREAGFHAMLVGEALLRSADPRARLAELLGPDAPSRAAS